MLNLAGTRNSPDRSTKSTRSYLNVVPQLVNTGFQVLFHSPPGVLFTFPSQYYALSVTKYMLSGKGCEISKTTRMLAQKQLFIQRVRNSSLVERSCAENVRG